MGLSTECKAHLRIEPEPPQEPSAAVTQRRPRRERPTAIGARRCLDIARSSPKTPENATRFGPGCTESMQ
jgi:hypothetical protein